MFEPGKSGNPGGKSKEREALRKLVNDHIANGALENVKAIELLASSALSEKVQLSARIWLGEQFLGKATQAITGADGGPLVSPLDLTLLSPEELTLLDQLRRRATATK